MSGSLEDALFRNKYDKGVDDELRIACSAGHFSDIVPWLSKGANVNSFNEFGFTPLVKAAENNHPKCILSLIDHGAEVDKAPLGNFPGFMVNQNQGQTPLAHAAGNGHEECVAILLAAAADVDGGTGTTPLYEALGGSHVEIVRMLLAHGADANRTRTKYKNTPLMMAVSGIDVSPTCISLLLQQDGIDVDAIDVRGHTALYYACESHCIGPVVELLVGSGANISERDIRVANGEIAIYLSNTSLRRRRMALAQVLHSIKDVEDETRPMMKVLQNDDLVRILRGYL